MPARGEGTLPGRKPIAFCAWLFDLLGMRPGDILIDLFPGTGIVTRAWAEVSSGAGATASLVDERPSSGAATSGFGAVRVVEDLDDDVAPRGTTDGAHEEHSRRRSS
jgi:predicted methyltransferase